MSQPVSLSRTADVVAKLKAGELPPRAAMRVPFAPVALATEGNSNDSKTIKVNLKARQRGSINHWWWGEVWHDLSSYRTKGPKVALDDSHGTEIGYGRPYLAEYGLEIDGVVIPNPDCPEHESNRIAYNLRNGIPQEASIDFTGDYEVLEVPEGFSAPCNGMDAVGPCLIVKNWPLRAVAICKEGADASTSTEMATALKGQDQFGKGPKKISTFGAPAAANVPAPTEGGQPETPVAQSPAPTQQQDLNTMSTTATPAAAPAAAPTTLSTPAAPVAAPSPAAAPVPAPATQSDNVSPVPALSQPNGTAPVSAPAATAAAAPVADPEKQNQSSPPATAGTSATPADGTPVEAPSPEKAKAEEKPVEAKPAQPTQATVPAAATTPNEALTALQGEITELTQKLATAEAEIVDLKGRLEAAGNGAPALPKGSPDANPATMKWSDALEATRKAMKEESVSPLVMAEAIRRYPEVAKRVRTTK